MPEKSRNSTVDMLRGMAILMVVLGHTMTGCVTGAEETLLFNIIWSLQMPLFFLISGYVTKYSRTPQNIHELRKHIGKRTRAYLLPWAVWSFLIRGLLFGERMFFDLKYLLWHMDSGYWFLFSLWTITLIFTVVQFVARRYKRAICAWGGTCWALFCCCVLVWLQDCHLWRLN